MNAIRTIALMFILSLATLAEAQEEKFCMENFGLPQVCIDPAVEPDTVFLNRGNGLKFPVWGATPINAIALGKDYDPEKYLLAGWFRTYADNARPGSKIIWGLVTEVVASNRSTDMNIVSIESAAVNFNPNGGSSIKTGLNPVFKNRLDTDLNGTVPSGVGKNEYNLNAYAIWPTAQPRSKAGEYSGWQSIIKVDKSALDRTATQPYTAVVDLGDVESDNNGDDPYMLVWKCGAVKCGVRHNRISGQTEFIRDIVGAKEVRGSIDMNPAMSDINKNN